MPAHRCVSHLAVFLSVLWLGICANGDELTSSSRVNELSARALWASIGGYTPSRLECPSVEPMIRAPYELSPDETSWLQKRKKVIRKPMKDLLGRLNLAGFDSGSYLDSLTDDKLPTVGIAMSGGGYRALLVGAGAMAAFDDRTKGATESGHLGGLLQASTYVSGLSGGGWLVGSIWVNNFTSVQDIIDGQSAGRHTIWNFERSMLEGPKTSNMPGASSTDYWKDIWKQVMGKKEARFDTSVTDYWSRGLAYQMINSTEGGAGYTWSSIAEQPGFPEAQNPIPILVACNRSPGEILVARNTTVFEFSPWEMGSWDPTLFAMAPIKYVGSDFHSGKIRDKKCVTGFDNAAFVMGTSSSLFNAVVAQILTKDSTGILSKAMEWLKDFAEKLTKADNDIASWTPNPFHGFHPHINKHSVDNQLSLVDGGEDYQNIPLYPHIQPVRKVDVVFAVDSSADSGTMDGWPNGTAMVATYDRHLDVAMSNNTVFPAVPDVNTFTNLGLNARPTFFGCDPKNLTGPSPIIVYIPNHPYTFYSNISTSTSVISNKERDYIIRNGYHVATMGNGTIEAEWPACVGCAMLSRSFDRNGVTPPQVCQDCFKKHCWNGTIDSKTPPKFEPKLLMPQASNGNKTKVKDDKKDKKKNGATSLQQGWSTVLSLALVISITLMI